MRLLGLVGAVVAVTGFALLGAPTAAARVLHWVGLRRTPHPASRVAAWMLVILGVAIAVVSRLIR